MIKTLQSRIAALTFFLIPVLFVLGMAASSCTSLGLLPAKSFEQRLAYAYATHTAVLETAAQAVRAGTLAKADGEAFLKISDQARLLLDSALNVYKQHDEAGANNKLGLATAILTELQSYLQHHLGT